MVMAASQYLTAFLPQSTEFEECRANVYGPLNTSRHEIRLVTIHPGSVDDQIRMTLGIVSLDDHSPYEAVSYTWGDLKDTRTVEFQKHEYIVTKNQFDAVRNFRREDVTRILWMDVFCIDQANLTEKGQQVSMMGEIYAGAITTLIWLGQFERDWIGTISDAQLEQATELIKANPRLPRVPGDDNNIITSPHLSEFNSFANGENGPFWAAMYAVRLLAGNHHLLQMPIYSIDSEGNPSPNLDWYRALETLRKILSRPWWDRAWVLQEVAWSKQPPMVHMGVDEISLEALLSVAAALGKHVMFPSACCVDDFQTWSLRDLSDPQALFTRVNSMYGFHRIREIVADRAASIGEVSQFARNRKVTDPRDCIYSLLSVVPTEQRVRVDYKQTVAEVYTSASWMVIRVADSLNPLQEAGLKNGSSSWHLPSWAQNWSRSSTYAPFSNWIHNAQTYLVSPDWRRTVLDTGNGSLTVPATPIDAVEACIPAIAASRDWTFHVLTTIWLRKLRERGYDFDLATVMRTVFRNTGINTDSPFKPGDLDNLVSFYRQRLETKPEGTTGPEPKPPPGITPFDLQFAFSSSIRESCLFMTKQKRLGIGYEGIRPGDCLYHVRGCCTPLAIRGMEESSFVAPPSDNSGTIVEDVAERFTMIDACYVDGGMDLENADVDWDQVRDIKLI